MRVIPLALLSFFLFSEVGPVRWLERMTILVCKSLVWVSNGSCANMTALAVVLMVIELTMVECLVDRYGSRTVA